MCKQKIHKQGGLKTNNQQSAYILMLSIVLLLAMLMASLNFFEQSSDNIQMSGYNRDSSESLLLAESAMNLLYGKFKFQQDIDGDGTPDWTQTLDTSLENPMKLKYAYYITDKEGIDQKLPSLLQRIANGEARNQGASGIDNSFNVSQNTLLVENLYTKSASPIVYELNANNELNESTKKWQNITSSRAAAVWFEFVSNPELDGEIQFYVQAISKVGNSKSYVQRYVANYPNTLGSTIPVIGESSTR